MALAQQLEPGVASLVVAAAVVVALSLESSIAVSD